MANRFDLINNATRAVTIMMTVRPATLHAMRKLQRWLQLSNVISAVCRSIEK